MLREDIQMQKVAKMTVPAMVARIVPTESWGTGMDFSNKDYAEL